jgi:glucose/arabinose dehydrogenase
LVAGAAVPLVLAVLPAAQGSAAGPQVLDPSLEVLEVATGLTQPTSMAFLGDDDMFVLEKGTGRVQRVRNGQVTTVLDLPVNSNSERGLLGIALHPSFPANPGVYLRWNESISGADSTVAADTPLLGGRVDRFVWNGSALTFDRNLILLRSRQNDATNTTATGAVQERGNHNGGPMKFGPDGKLYVIQGDTGRRGQMQNLPDGPGCVVLPCPNLTTTFPVGNLPDDQYGGPEPVDSELTGVILRLNDDGSTPADNPFVKAGAEMGGEAGENLAKVFAYGVRNSFGLSFDPFTGDLWNSENGDDSFSEINYVQPGNNNGWIQNMGPISRVNEFRAIETGQHPLAPGQFAGAQQVRWNPLNAATTEAEARARMFDVTEGGSRFVANLDSAHEVPTNASTASGRATFQKQGDTLRYALRVGNITGMTMSHIHLGAPGQNGPVVAFLLGPIAGGMNVAAEQQVAAGTLTQANIIARPPGFNGTMAELLKRLRQGRAYVNVHTVARPAGEIRGKIQVTDAKVVSKYSDPEFSWRFEVAPGGVGFMETLDMGGAYHKDMFVGAASANLRGGPIFRFDLVGSRNSLAVSGPLADEVADNVAKYGITESEPQLFGTDFGVTTDIQTGPNGQLYVVSLSLGTVYRIHKK